jgi:tol-pal system protein YbgF
MNYPNAMFQALRRWPLALAAALAVCAAPARAALFEDDEARKAILDLRAKLDAQQKQQAADLEQLKRSLLDLANQIEQLRAELARNRGATEQLSNDVATLQRQQRTLSQGLDDRLKQLEPVPVMIDGKSYSVDPQEKRSFDGAMAAFKSNDYPKAIAGFNDLLDRYSRSPYAPQSLYWLGNAYYAQRDCKQATNAFNQLATRYPDDARAAEALLSAGNCAIELNDKRAARRYYDAVVKQYPGTEEAATAKDRLARIK